MGPAVNRAHIPPTLAPRGKRTGGAGRNMPDPTGIASDLKATNNTKEG